MSRAPALRLWILILAVVAYAANGGHSHLAYADGETVSVLMCGAHGDHMVQMRLGDTVPQDTSSETCCGDCTHAATDAALSPIASITPLIWTMTALGARLRDDLSPRSPLWPGAPPQGPPTLA
ncbi:MAG: DUF2946 family protein [Pseudomonadota bacterium]